MAALQEEYLTDRDGNRVKVVLDIRQFQQMVEELEELDDIRAYDAAKASGDEAILFSQAVEEIRRSRQ